MRCLRVSFLPVLVASSVCASSIAARPDCAARRVSYSASICSSRRAWYSSRSSSVSNTSLSSPSVSVPECTLMPSSISAASPPAGSGAAPSSALRMASSASAVGIVLSENRSVSSTISTATLSMPRALRFSCFCFSRCARFFSRFVRCASRRLASCISCSSSASSASAFSSPVSGSTAASAALAAAARSARIAAVFSRRILERQRRSILKSDLASSLRSAMSARTSSVVSGCAAIALSSSVSPNLSWFTSPRMLTGSSLSKKLATVSSRCRIMPSDSS
mmetsp:Transcript_16287/g.56940  ORF Transcript_16287/g.56940 Transcript_16287/m.56940 type:complete len:278 (-) Transcript_16287:979-1812(-)